MSEKGKQKPVSSDVVWHVEKVDRASREKRLRQKGCVLWFTGLSGSGKSTLANAVCARLFAEGYWGVVLDGDNLRHGLCGDLGFSDAERKENIRRTAEVSRLFVESGQIVLSALISPFVADRQKARALFAEGEFVEIFVDCPFELCDTRDPKGLYAKAKAGKVANFTGRESSYEAPVGAEIHVDTGRDRLEICVDQVWSWLIGHGKIVR